MKTLLSIKQSLKTNFHNHLPIILRLSRGHIHNAEQDDLEYQKPYHLRCQSGKQAMPSTNIQASIFMWYIYFTFSPFRACNAVKFSEILSKKAPEEIQINANRISWGFPLQTYCKRKHVATNTEKANKSLGWLSQLNCFCLVCLDLKRFYFTFFLRPMFRSIHQILFV